MPGLLKSGAHNNLPLPLQVVRLPLALIHLNVPIYDCFIIEENRGQCEKKRLCGGGERGTADDTDRSDLSAGRLVPVERSNAFQQLISTTKRIRC